MILMTQVNTILNVSVDRRHDVPDLEADASHLYQVFLLQSITGHFHVRTAVVSHDSPDFLLRLLLEHLINRLIDIALMEDPISSTLVHQASNDLVSLFCIHLLLKVLKVIITQLSVHIGFTSIKAVASSNFELFLFEKLAFTLFDFKVK